MPYCLKNSTYSAVNELINCRLVSGALRFCTVCCCCNSWMFQTHDKLAYTVLTFLSRCITSCVQRFTDVCSTRHHSTWKTAASIPQKSLVGSTCCALAAVSCMSYTWCGCTQVNHFIQPGSSADWNPLKRPFSRDVILSSDSWMSLKYPRPAGSICSQLVHWRSIGADPCLFDTWPKQSKAGTPPFDVRSSSLFCGRHGGLELVTSYLRDTMHSVGSFRHKLKTFLFSFYSVHSALGFRDYALYKPTIDIAIVYNPALSCYMQPFTINNKMRSLLHLAVIGLIGTMQ